MLGEAAHGAIMRSPLIGYNTDCAQCWTAATQCNIASCAQHCFWKWNNPLSTKSTLGGASNTTLNECMHCDEIHCSAYFLQACGANRRSAGVVSDIKRPTQHICRAAHADARKRGTAPTELPPPTGRVS